MVLVPAFMSALTPSNCKCCFPVPSATHCVHKTYDTEPISNDLFDERPAQPTCHSKITHYLQVKDESMTCRATRVRIILAQVRKDDVDAARPFIAGKKEQVRAPSSLQTLMGEWFQ
jgi:hypothetical protein